MPPAVAPQTPPPNQPPKFTKEERIARLKKSYQEGKMSKEMYEGNLEKFEGM
ncbi:MAG: hypothetical protein KKD98_06445 [Candidatus Thermoplasmatota archaeon]|nr:hypothetical protein [Candidatus Thermoplasmatota archaeon]